ncbi:MAG: WbqC family protein [Bacteroidales bacterium]|nr:WbqC family protein [Bacteroidales bacterium]
MGQNSEIVVSTAYHGPIGYYVHLANADHIKLECEENYTKQTYRNRCRILTANGIQDLVIPVIKVNGPHTKIRDVKISYSEKWQQNHWRAIVASYSHSPFFLYYSDELLPFYQKEIESLFELDRMLTDVICRLIGIRPKIKFTESYQTMYKGSADLRESIHPKKQSNIQFPPYTQVFSDRMEFVPNLSIIDLLFNLGPDAKEYLENIELKVI